MEDGGVKMKKAEDGGASHRGAMRAELEKLLIEKENSAAACSNSRAQVCLIRKQAAVKVSRQIIKLKPPSCFSPGFSSNFDR